MKWALVATCLALGACVSSPGPSPCSGFRSIATKDVVVRGSQSAAELENAALDAFEKRDKAGLEALLNRDRDVLTTDTARAIVAHNAAWKQFCTGLG